ncbi:MAG: glycerophosphodiester phosphodiesterase [Chloroflexi bacterium]|nr:glycerophosphodiester phosphodiesterase [Chloroflexota bacterium]
MPSHTRPTIREAYAARRPLVFGHRGAMAGAPMNTLAAFQLAVDQGADGVELDAHLSRDGQIVVLHDFTVDATTDGSGQAADMTLAEIKRLDAGAWFHDDFAGERVPTLDEVFAAFADKLYFNVELKSRSDDGGVLAQAAVDCIRRHSMTDSTIVSSFDAGLLQRFEAVCPDVMMGYLHGRAISPIMENVPHQARHPWHEKIDAAYMRWARDAGFLVNAWTVNDAERIRTLKDLGVNGIITDSPADAIHALAQC